MNPNTLPAFLLCWLGLWAGTLGATPGSVQLERFLEGVTTLRADFEQSLFTPDRVDPLFSKGVFYLSRPDRFRWDYSEPEPQLIVADGRQVWLYDPDLEQVSVQSQRRALNGTPAALLISGEPVDRTFYIEDLGPAGGVEWVELTPFDEESQFARIKLGLSDNTLLRMEMIDKFGQVTRFRFSGIQQNPELQNGLFEFTPPDDVDRYSH